MNALETLAWLIVIPGLVALVALLAVAGGW